MNAEDSPYIRWEPGRQGAFFIEYDREGEPARLHAFRRINFGPVPGREQTLSSVAKRLGLNDEDVHHTGAIDSAGRFMFFAVTDAQELSRLRAFVRQEDGRLTPLDPEPPWIARDGSVADPIPAEPRSSILAPTYYWFILDPRTQAVVFGPDPAAPRRRRGTFGEAQERLNVKEAVLGYAYRLLDPPRWRLTDWDHEALNPEIAQIVFEALRAHDRALGTLHGWTWPPP